MLHAYMCSTVWLVYIIVASHRMLVSSADTLVAGLTCLFFKSRVLLMCSQPFGITSVLRISSAKNLKWQSGCLGIVLEIRVIWDSIKERKRIAYIYIYLHTSRHASQACMPIIELFLFLFLFRFLIYDTCFVRDLACLLTFSKGPWRGHTLHLSHLL